MKTNEQARGKVESRMTKSEASSKKRFQIVKLEPRIAPKLAANHNETIVRDNV